MGRWALIKGWRKMGVMIQQTQLAKYTLHSIEIVCCEPGIWVESHGWFATNDQRISSSILRPSRMAGDYFHAAHDRFIKDASMHGTKKKIRARRQLNAQVHNNIFINW